MGSKIDKIPKFQPKGPVGNGWIHMQAEFERTSPKTLKASDFNPKSWCRTSDRRQSPPTSSAPLTDRSSGAKKLNYLPITYGLFFHDTRALWIPYGNLRTLRVHIFHMFTYFRQSCFCYSTAYSYFHDELIAH